MAGNGGGGAQRSRARLLRLAQGAALGLGAPLGWQVLRWLFDLTPIHHRYELVLNVYMAVGGVLVFAVFGYHLGRKEQRLERLTLVDPLTSLYNRRHFELMLEAEFARHQRDGSDLSLLMLDLDHFKQVNDTWGHQEGDQVLMTLAGILRAGLRAQDVAARVGGEEFAVIMPGVGGAGALAAAERLRIAVRDGIFLVGPGTRIPVRISIGVASTERLVVSNPTELFRLADDALYRAKGLGRDRVEPAWPGGGEEQLGSC
ncbi:GGDEF domain-containing protein [Nitratidesulfovibrio sp. SRB-5]|uniref:GGDEF domain-containing protein n=1 Tax=Nitratidesulfovibrio sp. SRB-5 TaxID=2872636 RepID=UPI001027920B|nr:diguanylate cyclase [Nitratidesulfovibrio sp. SRB-5]MBZ2172477.1 diguanylate cyclase [Nitratidesulfovibrio sp. SRB-5]RXF77776.1 diguanylate cyclase [Desulfovibrio sp. DS-1]